MEKFLNIKRVEYALIYTAIIVPYWCVLQTYFSFDWLRILIICFSAVAFISFTVEILNWKFKNPSSSFPNDKDAKEISKNTIYAIAGCFLAAISMLKPIFVLPVALLIIFEPLAFIFVLIGTILIFTYSIFIF